MAHGRPAPQPALECGKLGLAGERLSLSPGRLSVAISGNTARTLKEGEIGLLLRQDAQKIAECRVDRQADAPAVAVPGAKHCHLPHDVRRRYARRELAVHCFGDYEA